MSRTIADTSSSTSLDWKGCAHAFTWHHDPFAHGSERAVYIGFATRKCTADGFYPGQKVVVKRFKKAIRWSESDWAKDLAAMDLVESLARQWNELGYISKKVEVLKSTVIKVMSSGSDDYPVDSYLMVEPFLDGDYVKWNSNSGYVRDKSLGIESFCHWTYHQSNGQHLVCDVQGVQLCDKYLLTDPCVMSTSQGKYGMTDCGNFFMTEWMKDHKCNQYCQKHWKNEYGSSSRPQRRSSLLSWQVSSLSLALGNISSATLSITPDSKINAYLDGLECIEEE